MVAINPALDPAQARQGPRGRALPDQGSRFWRHHQAVARSCLRGSVRLIAFEIVAFASLGAPGRERLTAARATLAERSGLGERTVRRCLKALVAAGFLVPDPNGLPHGARSITPTRYLVRFDALKAATWAEDDGGRSGHGDQTRSGHGGHQGLEASEGQKNIHASPTKAPKGAHAPDGTEDRKPSRTERIRWEANRDAAEGLRPDASPFHSASALLAEIGVDPVVRARLIAALGPETASDVARKVKRKRAVRNGGALFASIVKREHPEAWARFEASRHRGGTRSDRKRQRDGLELPPLDLGDGLRPPAVPPRHERTKGHEVNRACRDRFGTILRASVAVKPEGSGL